MERVFTKGIRPLFSNIMTLILSILSIILTILVALQSKGTGLSVVSGTEDFGKFERRGAEKTLHTITILLIVLFVTLCTVVYFIA